MTDLVSSPTPLARAIHGLAATAALLVVSLVGREAAALAPADCDPRGATTGGACFGLEPTFTNRDLIEEFASIASGGPNARAAVTRWRDEALQGCAVDQCRVERDHALVNPVPCDPTKRGKPHDKIADEVPFRVCIYDPEPDAKPWFYTLGFDQAVIELSTRPANAGWIGALADDGRLEAYLFAFARRAGLEPDGTGIGAGHIHVDPESGFDDLVHLFNFMTRVHNLRMLPLSSDVFNVIGRNAAPFSILGPTIRTAYQTFLDQRVAKGEFGPRDFRKALEALRADVYVYNAMSPRMLSAAELDTIADPKEDPFNRGKYHDVHIHGGLWTVELRSVNPQRSASDLAAMVRMLARAIQSTPRGTLLRLEDKLALDGTDADWERPWGKRRFGSRSVQLTDAEANDIARRFRDFVGDKQLLQQLLPYMPERIRAATRALLDAKCTLI